MAPIAGDWLVEVRERYGRGECTPAAEEEDVEAGVGVGHRGIGVQVVTGGVWSCSCSFKSQSTFDIDSEIE